VLAGELPEVGGLRRRGNIGAAPFGDEHQLGRHQGQVVAGLVLVAPAPQVHLRDRVQAVLAGRVQQHRDLDAVADRDRQRLHQLPARRPLPRQGLDHAGELGPPQAEQRTGHQLGDPAAVRGDGTVVVGGFGV
jgi:hypothetical protein